MTEDIGQYPGKCYRHGLRFMAGQGYKSCPACHFEGEFGNIRVKIEMTIKALSNYLGGFGLSDEQITKIEDFIKERLLK